MAITATAVTQASNNSNPTFSFGFTAAAGDLLVIAVGEDGAGTCTWPGSWVELRDQAFTGAAGYIAYLIAAGGETSVAPTSTVADRWEGVLWRFPAGEWHGTTAPEIATAVTGSSAAPNSGSITPSWGAETNNIFISVCFRDDSVANTITAYPANYTTAQLDNNATTSAANCGGAVRIVASGGSPEDPGAFTLDASETWMACTIAIRPAAAGTTVTPGVASLTLTTFAPTVSVSSNQLVTPGVASLTTTGFAPTVTASDHKTVTPGTASLTLTAFAPAITVGIGVVPATASLTLTAFAPTIAVSDNKTVIPGVATLSLTTFAPTVGTPVIVTPAAAGLTLTAFAPTLVLSDHKLVTPATASLQITSFAPTVTAGGGLTITPGVASLTLTAFAPLIVLSDHKLVTPGAASLSLTGLAPTVTASDHQIATPLTAALTLTAFNPTVTASDLVVVTPGVASLSLTTFAPTVSANVPIIVGGAPPGVGAAIHVMPSAYASTSVPNGDASSSLPSGAAGHPVPGS